MIFRALVIFTTLASGCAGQALQDTRSLLRWWDPYSANLVDRHSPVFDFDSDSCLPAAPISPTGEKNGGLKPTGHITGGCRKHDFMSRSNTLHRIKKPHLDIDVVYEVHMYELYFQKDQIVHGDVTWLPFGGKKLAGHRHDFETAMILFKNKVPMSMGVSAHGKYGVRPFSQVHQTSSGRPKVIYHKEATTHAFRYAKEDEHNAENPTKKWVSPPLATWNLMYGNGLTNAQMREKMQHFHYGKASSKIKDGKFSSEVCKFLQGVQPFHGKDTFPTLAQSFCLFKSSEVGGQSGDAYDDSHQLYRDYMDHDKSIPKVTSIMIRAGDRVDAVMVTLEGGVQMRHGGWGGHIHTLKLSGDEYITQVSVWLTGLDDRDASISRMEVTSSRGYMVSGGKHTRYGPYHIQAPRSESGKRVELVGFHGRSGSEVENIAGVFYTREERTNHEVVATVGRLTPPMEVKNDYITVPNNYRNRRFNKGTASFTVKATRSTRVFIDCEVMAATPFDDSFFIWFDNSHKHAWHTGLHWKFTWAKVDKSFYLTKGTHTLHVGGREDGAKMRAISIVSGHAQFVGYNQVAATLGSLDPPMQIEKDYIIVPNGNGNWVGSASFTVMTTANTQVTIDCEVIAPNGVDNSFYFWFDNNPKYTWHSPLYWRFTWSRVGTSFYLTKGTHTLHVGGREDGTKLRAIRIVSGKANFVGTGL